MRLYNVKVISTDIFGTKRATGDPRVSKRPYFLGLFGFPKKIEFLNCGFQDFWISSFFWISFHIFGTKRATGDPLVSKRPKFLGLYRFTKKLDFLGFWISGFLDFFPFFWISVHIFGNKRATGDPLVSKWPKFLGLYRFTKKLDFLDFWISGFLDFFIFLDFWPYLRK